MAQGAHVPADALLYIKQLYEIGQLDLAENAARRVLATDPSNRGARYYLAVIERTQEHRAKREPTPRFWIQTIPPRPIY